MLASPADSTGSTADRFHQVRLNRFVHMDTEALAGAVAPVRDQLAPALMQVPGCRTVMVGVDLSHGTGTVITFWESEHQMRHGSAAEGAARERALTLAGAGMGQGLVDSYNIVLEHATDIAGDQAWARLSHWEGVSPHRIWDALIAFEQHDLPRLEQLTGFRGLFVATNNLLGNTLSVSMWASEEDLQASLVWEADARRAVETVPGMSPRGVVADTYELVLAPTLREFRRTPSLREITTRTDGAAAPMPLASTAGR